MNNSFVKNSVIFIILIVCFVSCENDTTKDHHQVCFKRYCFDVELVKHQEERMRGLQMRKSLDHDKGMLFVFDQSQKHTFWMKKTLIPLDIIWMDYQRNVVHIEERVPPCKMDPCQTHTPLENALYVLEVNAGLVQESEIKIGDQAEFILKFQ